MELKPLAVCHIYVDGVGSAALVLLLRLAHLIIWAWSLLFARFISKYEMVMAIPLNKATILTHDLK